MQRCGATVILGGDVRHAVAKHGLSPAEVQVLRHIHGDDAVKDFRGEGNDKGGNLKGGTNGNASSGRLNERARLIDVYGLDAVKAVFPGANPELPEKFADIGVDLAGDDAGAVKGGKAKKNDSDGNGPTTVTGDDLPPPPVE